MIFSESLDVNGIIMTCAALQVMKLKVDLIGKLALNAKFTRRSAEFCLNELVDKVGDVKNGSSVQETLSCISEACGLEFVSLQVEGATEFHLQTYLGLWL